MATQADALAERAWALFEAGEPDEAIALADEAVGLDPACSAARCLRGVAHEATGELDEALAEYEAAVRDDPLCVPALIALGALRLERGEAGLALEVFDAALSLDGFDPGTHRLKGEACQALGRHGEAADAFASALAVAPSGWRPQEVERLRELLAGALASRG